MILYKQYNIAIIYCLMKNISYKVKIIDQVKKKKM